MPRPPSRPQSTTQPTQADFVSRLLAYLRATFEAPELEYAERPQAITGGFDTLTYSLRLDHAPEEFGRPLILRVFRADHPSVALPGAERSRFESAVQNTIGELGYPAPRVLHTCTDVEVLGASFMITERLPGRMMLDLFFRPSRVWARLPALLAEAHAHLHSLDAAALQRAAHASGIPAQALTPADRHELPFRIERASLNGLIPAMKWLLDKAPHGPGPLAICHGDFHPLNVLIDKGKVSGVIDWTYARIADPAYDVGATIALFGQGPIDLPGLLQSPADWFRRWIIGRYYRAYRQLRNVDEGAVRYYEALRCLGFLVEAGEHSQADRGVVARSKKPTAFGAPRTVRGIIARLQEITQVDVAIPPAQAR